MNIKKILSCVIFTFSFCFSYAEVINSIDIQGLQLASKDVVSTYLTISVGQDVTNDAIKEQISALYATGLFKQVEIEVRDHVLIINCTEQPVIRDIKIDDVNGVLPADQVKKQLEAAGIIKAERLNEVAVEEFRVMSQYSLRQYGFSNAEIETRIEDKGGAVAVLHIIIREGESTKLKSVDFEGDTAISVRELRQYVSSQTTGALSFYTMNDLYSEQRLHQDRERLVQLYQSKGYLAPSIELGIEDVRPFQRMWASNYKKATFTIDPGPKFYVDTVKFDNEKDEWPELLKENILESTNGKVLDHELMGELKQVLMEYYADEPLSNFYQIEVDHEIKGYDKVHVTFTLDKTISRVRFISFYGNRSTYDEPMRRALVIQEAKPFNQSTIRQTERALRNLGYLKDVTITPVQVGEDLYDINVEVKEAPTLQADLKMDFASLSGISLSASASDPNAFGTGNSAAISISGGFEKQQISASYIQPNFTLSGHKMSNILSYTRQSKSDKDKLSYHVDSFNYVLGYSIPLSNKMMLDFGGALLFDQYNEVDQAPMIVRDFFVDRNTLVKQYKASGGLTYQDIDSAYMPTKGIVLHANTSVTLPHSDAVTYFQMMGEGITYYPMGKMMDQPVVLRTRLMGQFVTDYSSNSGDIAFFARYFAGGLRTVRGYSALGPQYLDISPSGQRREWKPKGGNKLVVGNVELQLASPVPEVVIPYLFFDIGNVFDDSENVSLAKMRASAGISFAAHLPIGTMTFSLAMPFNNKPGDKFDTFSFGMGVSF